MNLLSAFRKWSLRRQWPVELQMDRVRRQILEDARWMGHAPLVAELCTRYEKMTAPDWMSNAVEPVSDFRRRLRLEPWSPTSALRWRCEQTHPTRDEISTFETDSMRIACDYLAIGWTVTMVKQE